jgi:hypothetical protein
MAKESETSVSPSRISGTIFVAPPSSCGMAVNGAGTEVKGRPLWASAMATFQQCGLKGRDVSAPTRSYRRMDIGSGAPRMYQMGDKARFRTK